MDKHKCSPNDYYDKLMETCKPCYLRCSKAPPSVCLTYCKQSVETVWIILGSFLLLGAVGVILTVSLQKLWKRRSSRYPQNTGKPPGVGDPEKTADPGRADSARETGLPDGLVPTRGDTDQRGTTADLQHISALPLPATEEGTTLLVTAKTTQLSSYPWDGPRDIVGLRRLDFVPSCLGQFPGLGVWGFGGPGQIWRFLGAQQNDIKRQHLLERLLDAVKQCQIRFGGRKEIASDSDSRVICLCAQFEAMLQHGLRRTRGLALTAAAFKQVAGFSSKAESELSFWLYVKEHLNRHELQRFYALRQISSEVGRGRAWLRCALNEHSLERYLHALLADRARLSVFYEDWAFLMDEERASMLPIMAAGLNSILFAINIDNTDLNGQSRGAPSVSDLLRESTQGVSSLWKESAQGVSTLLREISTATSAVPGFGPRAENLSDPLPVLPRSASADSGLKKERRRKKKVTHIISFDDDEEEEGEGGGRLRKGSGRGPGGSEEALEGSDPPPTQNGAPDGEVGGWGGPHTTNGEPIDSKSIDNEEEEEEDLYGRSRPEVEEERGSGEQPLVGSLSSVSTWSPLQVINDNDGSDILIPVDSADSCSQPEGEVQTRGYREVTGRSEVTQTEPRLGYSTDTSPAAQSTPLNISSPVLPESMTVAELRQAIVAMMNRKDELEEENRSLRSLLDGEMEHSAGLRQELDSLKKRLGELEERHGAKVQALGSLSSRENEVLKVQLKKYVGAVQMLKREGGQSDDVLFRQFKSTSARRRRLPCGGRGQSLALCQCRAGQRLSRFSNPGTDLRNPTRLSRAFSRGRGENASSSSPFTPGAVPYQGTDGASKLQHGRLPVHEGHLHVTVNGDLNSKTLSGPSDACGIAGSKDPVSFRFGVLSLYSPVPNGPRNPLAYLLWSSFSSPHVPHALPALGNGDGAPPAPPPKPAGDVEELAASYERKLIEVAEMHGELIEFNERLYRSLMAKDNLISQMRQELIDLRGPVRALMWVLGLDSSLGSVSSCKGALAYLAESTDKAFRGSVCVFATLWSGEQGCGCALCAMVSEPLPQSESSGLSCKSKAGAVLQIRAHASKATVPGDLSQTSEDPSLSDFETAHRALVNVWIPSVFLRGRSANAYHVYQIAAPYKRDALKASIFRKSSSGEQATDHANPFLSRGGEASASVRISPAGFAPETEHDRFRPETGKFGSCWRAARLVVPRVPGSGSGEQQQGACAEEQWQKAPVNRQCCSTQCEVCRERPALWESSAGEESVSTLWVAMAHMASGLPASRWTGLIQRFSHCVIPKDVVEQGMVICSGLTRRHSGLQQSRGVALLIQLWIHSKRKDTRVQEERPLKLAPHVAELVWEITRPIAYRRNPAGAAGILVLLRQVYIRILDNEWNVYRRYTDFRALHQRLRSRFPQVDTFNFPPKKAIGNKEDKLEERELATPSSLERRATRRAVNEAVSLAVQSCEAGTDGSQGQTQLLRQLEASSKSTRIRLADSPPADRPQTQTELLQQDLSAAAFALADRALSFPLLNKSCPVPGPHSAASAVPQPVTLCERRVPTPCSSSSLRPLVWGHSLDRSRLETQARSGSLSSSSETQGVVGVSAEGFEKVSRCDRAMIAELLVPVLQHFNGSAQSPVAERWCGADAVEKYKKLLSRKYATPRSCHLIKIDIVPAGEGLTLRKSRVFRCETEQAGLLAPGPETQQRSGLARPSQRPRWAAVVLHNLSPWVTQLPKTSARTGRNPSPLSAGRAGAVVQLSQETVKVSEQQLRLLVMNGLYPEDLLFILPGNIHLFLFAMGDDSKFVEERRKQLQSYLRSVMNKLIQALPEFAARPTKETLLKLLPFCQLATQAPGDWSARETWGFLIFLLTSGVCLPGPSPSQERGAAATLGPGPTAEWPGEWWSRFCAVARTVPEDDRRGAAVQPGLPLCPCAIGTFCGKEPIGQDSAMSQSFRSGPGPVINRESADERGDVLPVAWKQLDTPQATESGTKPARSHVGPRFPKLSRGQNRESRNPEPQSGDL
ncbi:SNX29 protein, partial [Atractosteus spatula]|nr:SNX29 protein [Atractosteus spatula]